MWRRAQSPCGTRRPAWIGAPRLADGRVCSMQDERDRSDCAAAPRRCSRGGCWADRQFGLFGWPASALRRWCSCRAARSRATLRRAAVLQPCCADQISRSSIAARAARGRLLGPVAELHHCQRRHRGVALPDGWASCEPRGRGMGRVGLGPGGSPGCPGYIDANTIIPRPRAYRGVGFGKH